MNQNIKIDPFGFREYDARWLYEESINKVQKILNELKIGGSSSELASLSLNKFLQ